MMSKGLYFIFGLAIGAVGGAGIGYFVFTKRYEGKFNKEVDSIKKSYNDILDKYKERLSKAEAELNEGVSSTDVVERATRALEGSTSDSTPSMHNYTAYSKNGVKSDLGAFKDKSSIKEPEPRELESLHPVDSDEDEEPEDDEVLSEEEQRFIEGLEKSNEHEATRKERPKLIRRDEYGNDGTQRQASLLYYTGNDVLVDAEDGSEVLDQDKYVGDCLDKFDFRTNGQETICVRNKELGIDFEITKILGYHSAPDYI